MPMLRNFPFFPQHDAMDCGPACLPAHGGATLRAALHLGEPAAEMPHQPRRGEPAGHQRGGGRHRLQDRRRAPFLRAAEK